MAGDGAAGGATVGATGEEFRAESARRGLPAKLVKELTALDPVKAWLSVAQTWGVIAALIAAPLIWWEWYVIAPAMVLLATRQQALFVLAHDAAHYRLFGNRALNDAVGRACGAPVGISMLAYRVVHRLHHNHLYEKQDPDTPIHGGYPRGRAYLVRKLLRDLFGLTAYKTYAYFFGAPAAKRKDGAIDPLGDTSEGLRAAALGERWVVAGFHVAAPLAAFASGYLLEYLLLWVVPLVFLLQPILRFRSILEHGMVRDLSSAWTAARTNTGPGWLMWLLFPHHVHYHVEHHIYPSIPHYNLPRAHRELRERGLLKGAEVRPAWETMALAFGEPARA